MAVKLTATEQAVLIAMPSFEYFADGPMEGGGAWGATITRDITQSGLAENTHAAAALLSSLVRKGVLTEKVSFRTVEDGGWFDLTADGFATWVRLAVTAKNDATTDENATEHAERTRNLPLPD